MFIKINKFCRCLSVGDSIAILGPIDPVLGAVDSSVIDLHVTR